MTENKKKIDQYKSNLYSRKYINDSKVDLEKLKQLRKKKYDLDNN
jgi:hypothetical protein